MRLGSEEMKLSDSHVCIDGRSAPMELGVVIREKESSVVEGRVSAPALAPSTGERPKDATRDSTPSISSRSMGTAEGVAADRDGAAAGAD